MNPYQQEKLKRYREAGLRECCGVPTGITLPCAFRLCPIEAEKRKLQETKQALQETEDK